MKLSVKKVLYWSSSIILPLPEARSIGKNIGRTVALQRKHLGKLRDELKRSDDAAPLSFEEALAASGRDREALIQRYTVTRRLLLVLTFLPASALFVVLMTAALHPQLWSGAVALRVLGWTVLLSSMTAWLGLLTTVNAWRVWQLQNRRLSEDEHGTFEDFLATPWLMAVLKWKA